MEFCNLHMETQNLQSLFEFYTNILRFEVSDQTTSSFSIKSGYSTVTFHQQAASRSFYHFAFHVPAHLFDDAYNYFQSKVPILPVATGQYITDFKNWDARSFYFLDPCKNIVEIITHVKTKINSRERFTLNSLTHLIEIGWVTDNVTATCQKLQEDYGLAYFHKGPVTENFAVMGDERGMFIVVTKDRHWFPTVLPAAISETKVLVKIEGQQVEINIANQA
jgi:hypothetical protein